MSYTITLPSCEKKKTAENFEAQKSISTSKFAMSQREVLPLIVLMRISQSPSK